jgi:hypothetical protein
VDEAPALAAGCLDEQAPAPYPLRVGFLKPLFDEAYDVHPLGPDPDGPGHLLGL